MNTQKQSSMKEIIVEQLRPKMISLFWKAAEGGKDMMMDGVWVYNEKAQFTGGKAIGMGCRVVLEFLKGTPDEEKGIRGLKQLIETVADLKMETWGILNAITGLYGLKKAGILSLAADEKMQNLLKEKLDWRTFVDVNRDYALINKPTNYYGVAFGIARYRELLGWEEEGSSQILLNKLMTHIDRYSGTLGYMDETAGSGRFDRYSILIPGEIASLLMGTGMEVPEKIRQMLRRSVDIFLMLADEDGCGFSYGRSIGAYGDTAPLEVLSAAVEAGGIFSGRERELAYAYSVRLMEQMLNFWYDQEMGSINMWEKGRRTDQYRNKNRILGENMSLFMQVLNSYEHWRRCGLGDEKAADDYTELLKALPSHKLIRFAEKPYPRALAIVRDGGAVWSLPIINGGRGYYKKDAYLPGVYANGLIGAVPDESYGAFLPELVLADGRVCAPVSYACQVEEKETKDSYQVIYSQEVLGDMGKEEPEPVEGIRSRTVFSFTPGRVRREDVFCLDETAEAVQVKLAQGFFSANPQTVKNQVDFENGRIKKTKTEGYDRCVVDTALSALDYGTPRGKLETKISWEGAVKGKKEIRVAWEIEY